MSRSRIPCGGFRIATCLLLALVSTWSPAASPASLAKQPASLVPSADTRPAAIAALKEVDALLRQAGEITGLPIRHPVKSAVASREQIQRYLTQRLQETTTSEELRAQEVALKEFGLLPADFELEQFLVKLLTEQATAYYDGQQKQFYIADWTPLTVLRPAMIHELTHALQDQQVDLEQFLQQAELSQDEQTARVAVVEGSGMLAMTNYMLSRHNPQELLSMAAATDLKQFPVFQNAPLYLRESLMFPYIAGMQYMRWLVGKEGKAGYAVALKNPPRSTAEVLHPGRAAPASDDFRTPEVSPLPAGYRLLGSNVFGELDVRILLKQYTDEGTARRLAPAWRGFRYAVYENQSRSHAFLVHRSRWQDAKAAAAFADAYRKVLTAKGEKHATVQLEGDTVTVFEGPIDQEHPGAERKSLH